MPWYDILVEIEETQPTTTTTPATTTSRSTATDIVRDGMFQDPEEGSTRSSADSVYHKTYYFYSGSAISRDEFKQSGYQNSFDWISHAYVYANESTTYTTIQTYTLVGTTAETLYGVGDYVSSSTVSSYEWFESESAPRVAITDYGTYMYVHPDSIGIMAEVDGNFTNQTVHQAAEAHTHEEVYTDNSEMDHGTWSEGADAEISVWSSISSPERDFIKNLFDATPGISTFTAIETHLHSLSRQIFNTSLVAKNVYTTVRAPEIKQINLREMSAFESAFSASVNTNIVSSTTPYNV
jgi:hypothetical protein